MTPNTTRTLASGMALWAIMLLLPAAHMNIEMWLRPRGLIWLLGPPIVLFIAQHKNRIDWLLVLYPTSLLPAILEYPEIISHSIYGPLEFAVLMIATIVFFYAASVRTSTPQSRQSPQELPKQRKPTHSRAVASLTVFAAMALFIPSFSLHFDTDIRYQLVSAFGASSNQATVYISLLLFTSWTIMIMKLMVHDFAAPLLTKHPYKADLYKFSDLHLKRHRAFAQAKWAILVGLAFGLLLLALQSTVRGL